ncbi:uncharacterized protein N0V89_004843 [Didymosphaeria variabile]|uniref:Uncharacterized protein n=1 Tax=Didymosphaeria variabile TaxID=1932322 RepID=A0A9W8XRZ3_9PLEO|nr:uncharacterized protein N0V89_004843 [Didymosphaeria variabile]KAJ4356806.1 hypothetical protein N0V89_004843 [Didymosphaeria variabile]
MSASDISESDYSDLWFDSVQISANVQAQGRSTQPIPVKQPPATPLTPLKAPESGTLAALHPSVTEQDHSKAIRMLREKRQALVELICKTPKCVQPSGQLTYEWRRKVTAIEERVASSEDINDDYMERMKRQREEDNPEPSSSRPRPRLKGSADSGAWWVGGQSTKGMVEGDIEQAALMDAEGDVEMELEGVL